MKRTKFFCATLISVFALFAFFSCSNPANSGTPSHSTKSRGAKIVNVTYDANGGSLLSKSVYDYALGSTPETEMAVAKKAGYRFTNWNTKADGTGEIFNKDFVVVDSIKVYAQWEFYATPFEMIINYSYAEEDGVTLGEMPQKAWIAMGESILDLHGMHPEINENSTRDFLGYFDANGVKVVDVNSSIIPNTPYADVNGRWTYDYDWENVTSLDLYPRWGVSIKATEVYFDYSTYNIAIGEEITITGTYYPANATTTLNYNFTYDDRALIPISNFICEDGVFSITVKGGIVSNNSLSATCKYYTGLTTNTASCAINVNLPSDLSTVPYANPAVVPINNSIPINPIVSSSSSTNPDDYTWTYYDENTKGVLYKIHLDGGKTYYFETDDSDTYYNYDIGYVDTYFYLYNSSGTQLLSFDSEYSSYDITSTGDYYVYLSRYNTSFNYEGYAGFHIYLDCITEIGIQPQNYYDQDRYNYSTGTYSFKPFESLDFDVVYTPYKSISSPTVWLDATVTNTDIVALDDTYIDPADGKYITLTANKTGITDIVIQDDYSGFGIHYFLEVMTDGTISSFDTSSSTDIDDYTVMQFEQGLNSVKWYNLSLSRGHRYAFQTGDTVNAIKSEFDPSDYTILRIDIYDSDMNCIAQDISEFPCLSDGNYYVCFIPGNYSNKMNAFHIYDMGAILTSISINDSTFSASVGDSSMVRVLTLTPEDVDGDFEVISDYPGFADASFYNTTDSTLDDTQPDCVYIVGKVPGNIPAKIRDNLSGLEIPITIKVSEPSSPTVLSLPATYKSPNYVNSSDFRTGTLDNSTPYLIYYVNLVAGIKYHFQLLDSVYNYGFTGTYANANFYLEKYNTYEIIETDESVSGIMTYTCQTSGIYYFVIARADSSSGYAGVRFYAEPITSLDDFEIPLTIPADHTVTNDITIPYSPEDAYYNFSTGYFSTSYNERGLYSKNRTGNVLQLVGGIPTKGSISIEDYYSLQDKTYPITIVPTESTIPKIQFSTTPDDPTDLRNVSDENLNFADLSNKKYNIWSMDLVKDVTYHFLLLDSEKSLMRTDSFSDCYFYMEKDDY